VNVGFVNPVAVTTNVSGEPGMTVLPGESAPMDIVGGGRTMMVCVTLAELSLPDAVNVSTCVPTSLGPGVQEKRPPGSILFTDALEFANESCKP
jgi:hypothetical protein